MASRLLNYSRARSEDHQYVLMRYGLERLLYRLGRTVNAGRFAVKGAFLFYVRGSDPYRATRDLDLTATGRLSVDEVVAIFREACRVEAAPDGLAFPVESVMAEEIREGNAYGGVRVTLEARLGRARIPLQVDIGFADAITPEPVVETFPVLLAGLPAPVLAVCPGETVVAEKLETLVRLGMANSRLKDYYDIWVLSREFSFDGERLRSAFEATFRRRRTGVPRAVPVGLSDAFAADREKSAQWQAFLNRVRPRLGAGTLAETVTAVREFVMAPLEAVRSGRPFPQKWPPGGPWRSET